GKNQCRLQEGKGFRIDQPLACGEECTAEAGEHGPHGEGRQLDVGGAQAEGAAGDLVFAERFPCTPDGHADHAVRYEQGDQGKRERHQIQIDDDVHVVELPAHEFMERGLAFGCAARHGHAEYRGLGNTRNAVGTTREVVQVDEQQTNDLAEAQGNDGEVVAAQTQDREAQKETEQAGHGAGQWQRFPETPARPVVKQRIGIRTHGIEADEAEIQEACKAHHDIQSQAQHDVDEHEGGNIDFGTAGKEGPDQRDGDQQEDHGAPRGVIQHRHGELALATAHDTIEGRPHEGLEDENDRHADQHHVPFGLEVRLLATAHDLQPERGRDDHAGHDGRDHGILDVTEHYTFSTSGLPSSPVGRNSRMSTRRLNATVSLYCEEMYAAAKVSARPSSTPPNMAPGMLPIPPSTAAVNALMPARKPMKGLSLPMASAMSTPPTAASMAPTTKVKEMILLVSMPNRLAMRRSCEQAREARPRRECLMYMCNMNISTTVTRMIMMREYGAVIV